MTTRDRAVAVAMALTRGEAHEPCVQAIAARLDARIGTMPDSDLMHAVIAEARDRARARVAVIEALQAGEAAA